MPRYVVLINFTGTGVREIKDLPRRVQATREAIEKAGGKRLDWYLTLGPYDAVTTVEVPDDAAAGQLALAVGSLGHVRTTTLKAFTESEMTEMVGKLR